MNSESIAENVSTTTLLERAHKSTTAVDQLLLWEYTLSQNMDTLDIVEMMIAEAESASDDVQQSIETLRKDHRILDKTSGSRLRQDANLVRMWDQVQPEFVKTLEKSAVKLASMELTLIEEDEAKKFGDIGNARPQIERGCVGDSGHGNDGNSTSNVAAAAAASTESKKPADKKDDENIDSNVSRSTSVLGGNKDGTADKKPVFGATSGGGAKSTFGAAPKINTEAAADNKSSTDAKDKIDTSTPPPQGAAAKSFGMSGVDSAKKNVFTSASTTQKPLGTSPTPTAKPSGFGGGAAKPPSAGTSDAAPAAGTTPSPAPFGKRAAGGGFGAPAGGAATPGKSAAPSASPFGKGGSGFSGFGKKQ